MRKTTFMFAFALLAAGMLSAQGYKVGDKAADFRLKNVDGNYVSMSDFPDAKGFVVIFTCNHCPVAVDYEDRIIELDKKYKASGFPVIAINPNDPALEPRDSFENMQKRAREKGFTFPYLVDEGQKVFPKYGARVTPHIYLLKRSGGDLIVSYIGALDDSRNQARVEEKFLANAITALLEGNSPDPDFTRAVGCSIKVANR